MGEPIAPSGTILPGLCSITLRDVEAAAVIDLAAAAGLAGIEWGADVHVRPGDLVAAGQVAADGAAAGVPAVSYGSYLGSVPGTRPTAGEVAAVLDTAEALGVGLVRVWTEFGVVPTAAAEDRARVVATTASIADAAAARGLAIALEFHPGTLTETASSTMALLDELDRPGVRTHWQPDPTWSTDQALAELASVADRLAHLHTFSWGPGGFVDRRPLASGEALWPGVFELAARAAPLPGGAPRFALCEFVLDDAPEQLMRDACTLRGWLDRLGGGAADR